MNNVWLKTKKMSFAKEMCFRLMLTFNDQKYTLCYDSGNKMSTQAQLPLAVKDKSFQGNKDFAYSVKILLVKKGIQLVLNNSNVLAIDSPEQIK